MIKHLLKQFDHMAVQVYYTFYLLIAMAFVTWFLWYPTRKRHHFNGDGALFLFRCFSYMILLLFLRNLSMPNSLISVISTLRFGQGK